MSTRLGCRESSLFFLFLPSLSLSLSLFTIESNPRRIFWRSRVTLVSLHWSNGDADRQGCGPSAPYVWHRDHYCTRAFYFLSKDSMTRSQSLWQARPNQKQFVPMNITGCRVENSELRGQRAADGTAVFLLGSIYIYLFALSSNRRLVFASRRRL